MLEQSYKVLKNCGSFVDERLLDKGIYSTSMPHFRKWNTTMEDIIQQMKQYHSYLGGEYALPICLENLAKCELVEVRSFIGDNAKEYCDNLIEISKTSPHSKELLEALQVCYKSLCTYGSHPIIEKQVENVLSKVAGR
jgi:phosphoenolpyruvate carboxylase